MNAEEKLEKIRSVFNTERPYSDDPKDRSVISSHAYYNLEGAMIDLQRLDHPDDVIWRTLRRVRGQLAEIGKILETE